MNLLTKYLTFSVATNFFFSKPTSKKTAAYKLQTLDSEEAEAESAISLLVTRRIHHFILKALPKLVISESGKMIKTSGFLSRLS